MLDRRKALPRFGPDALGRRIGLKELRVLLLQGLESPEEVVPGSVGDLGLADHVVEMVVAAKLLAQGRDLACGLGLGALGGIWGEEVGLRHGVTG